MPCVISGFNLATSSISLSLAVGNIVFLRVCHISNDRFNVHACCLAFLNQRLQLLAVILFSRRYNGCCNNSFFGHGHMCLVSKERGIRTLMTYLCIRIFRNPQLLQIICDRFFQQVQRFFDLGQRADAAFRFNNVNEFLAVGNFVFKHIVGVLGGNLAFKDSSIL